MTMTPRKPRTTYTARGPVDLIALAPYVLGFRPADSVVLMTFGGAEPFHARIDLPSSPEEQAQVASLLHDVVHRHAIAKVAVLVYSDDVEAAGDQARLLVESFTDDGVTVVDAIRVEDEAYFDALDPDDPGTPYDVGTHPMVLSRIVEGQVALDSRDELADSLVGGDPDDADEVSQAATRFADSSWRMIEKGLHPQVFLHDEARWLRRVLGEGLDRRLEPHEAGRVLVLLQRTDLRDVAWAGIRADRAREHVDLWRDLVRRAPHDLLAPAAALLGFACWLAGDGALAWCAVDRCREADPDYSLATEIARALENAVPPSLWPGVRDDELPALRPPVTGPETRPETRSA